MAQAAAALATLFYWCLSAWYIRIQTKSPPGLPRFAACIPFFIGSFAIPLLYDHREDPLTVMTVFSMLCLASFKVLAWCINRGPLCLQFTPTQFLAILHFPVMPAEVTKTTTVLSLDSSADDASKLLTRCITKIALLGAFNQIIAAGLLPPLLQTYCLGLSMCFFLGAVQDMMAFIATHWLGLRVAPLFDQPWLSKTVGEWWSHRWNVPASLIFRVLVYDPIIERRWVLPQGEKAGVACGKVSSLQRAAAMAASFGLSAFGHEVMYWFAMRHFSGWWTVFFVVQAPIAIVERALKKQLEAAGLQMPAWLHMLRANLLVTYTAHLFFIGAATRDGLTDRIHGSIASTFHALLYPLTGHPTIAQPVTG